MFPLTVMAVIFPWHLISFMPECLVEIHFKQDYENLQMGFLK